MSTETADYLKMAEQVIHAVSEASGVACNKILPDTRIDSLGMDSLELVELMQTLNIPFSKASTLESIKDLFLCCLSKGNHS